MLVNTIMNHPQIKKKQRVDDEEKEDYGGEELAAAVAKANTMP